METVDYKALTFAWAVFQGVCTFALFLYTWITSRQKANTAAIDDVNQRLIQVETDLKHLPDHDDMKALHDRVNDANDKLSTMAGQLEQISRAMSMMHEHLLNGGKQ